MMLALVIAAYSAVALADVPLSDVTFPDTPVSFVSSPQHLREDIVLQTTSITGYVTSIGCPGLKDLFIISLPIGPCIDGRLLGLTTGASVQLVGTSLSDTNILTYTDSACSAGASTYQASPLPSGCAGGAARSYAFSTTLTPPTDAAIILSAFTDSGCNNMVGYRGYSMNKCASDSTTSSLFTCSGNTLTTYDYSTTTCTGTVTSGTQTYPQATCVVAPSFVGIYVSVNYCISSAGSPSGSPSGGASSCFAGSETLTMESGDSRSISEIKVGDRILSATSHKELVFADVISVPHGSNGITAAFTHITAGPTDIKLTADHLLFSGKCGSRLQLTRAVDVTVNSCIETSSGQETVTDIAHNVVGKGIYTVVTTEEYLVVNGIIASPFAINHMVPNGFYQVYRALYKVIPGLFSASWFMNAHEVLSRLLMASDI